MDKLPGAVGWLTTPSAPEIGRYVYSEFKLGNQNRISIPVDQYQW